MAEDKYLKEGEEKLRIAYLEGCTETYNKLTESHTKEVQKIRGEYENILYDLKQKLNHKKKE